MSEARPRVGIVVLTWNGRELLLECLDSLARLEWRPLDVIVVDNASTDGTAEALIDRGGLEVIRNERNLGSAGGNNVGLRRALDMGCDYAFLLNNDTTVAPDVVAKLVAEAERRPDAGALCPLIYFSDPDDLIWYAGGSFDPSRGRSGRMYGYRTRDRGAYREVRQVGRGVGAAMLVPSPVLTRVGFLDPELFLQYEDIEWSLRMRHAGYRIYLVPSARIWHKVSVASGGEDSPTIAYYGMRNHLEVCRRYAPLSGVKAFTRALVALAVHLSAVPRARTPLVNLRATLAGWSDYRRRRLGRRSTGV